MRVHMPRALLAGGVMCICTCAHTCTYACTYAPSAPGRWCHVYMHMRTYMHLCVYICPERSWQVVSCVYAHAHIHAPMRVHIPRALLAGGVMCICTCAHACTYACTYPPSAPGRWCHVYMHMRTCMHLC